MKRLFFLGFFWVFFGFGAFGQVRDSIEVVREVDSLMSISQKLIDGQQVEAGLSAIIEAKNLATHRFGRESLIYGKIVLTHGKI